MRPAEETPGNRGYPVQNLLLLARHLDWFFYLGLRNEDAQRLDLLRLSETRLHAVQRLE